MFVFYAEDGKSKVIDATNSSNQTNKQHIAAQTFTLRELVAATKNFRPDCLIGEGGFGRVYKGRLESTGQESICHYLKFRERR